MSKQRKQYTAQEKVAILRRHLLDKVPVSELCDEYGLQPTVFYRWQKQLFEQAAEACFQSSRSSEQARLKRQVLELEARLAKKDEVLGEVMEEYVTLKKHMGHPDWLLGAPASA
jgi:transposase